MKLRFEPGHVRLRLSDAERLALRSGEVLSESYALGDVVFSYSLRLAADRKIEHREAGLWVQLPHEQVCRWVDDDRVSLCYEFNGPGDAESMRTTTLWLEKDLPRKR